MKKINLAIVGATGLVGSTFLKVLEEKNYIKINNLYLYASKKSEGNEITFRNKKYSVLLLDERNITGKKIDFALFSAGGSVSKEFAPLFTKTGATVIDNSSAWRMETTVPLVVPQVNPEDINYSLGIISNPNCSTIQCMPPLKALHEKFALKKVIFTTFQAVSGSGIKGLNDLKLTTDNQPPQFYPHPIYNNCLPQIDSFLENGYTKEEMKMVNETRKILHLSDLPISATCVRVPIENSHSVDIYIELEKDFSIEEIRECLTNYPSIIVQDNIEKSIYPLASNATNKDEIFVGRIRRDISSQNAVRLFCVADNIRKGAASNAIEILELFLKT